MAELQERMSEREFSSWRHFYRQQPFDDLHRYHRPAALIAASTAGKYREKIDFLAPEPEPIGYSKADAVTLKTFGLRPPARRH